MRWEDRRLVGLLAVADGPGGLPVARGPVLADPALLAGVAFAGCAGVQILGADVGVSLASRHDLNVDIVVGTAPGR
jgi:hypothetical protein